MIGYRKGYLLQSVIDLTLPSVETFENVSMYPATGDGANIQFYFDSSGLGLVMSDRFGRVGINNGQGMIEREPRYGIDYVVFVDGKIVEKEKISVSTATGSMVFNDIPLSKSGTAATDGYGPEFSDATINFIDSGVTTEMDIQNLTAVETGNILSVSAHTIQSDVSWNDGDEYLITGNILAPPKEGAVLTCNYYRRKAVNVGGILWQDILPNSSIYSIGIIPKRYIGWSFTNL